MDQKGNYPLNTLFKPAAVLKISFTVNFLGLLVLFACFLIFPILFGTGVDFLIILIVAVSILAVIVAFLLWVSLYYESMWYELREDELSWKRGVWFHTTGIVPYNRITNIDIRQGPVMRALGISTLAIQTAGYSGQSIPELKIEGMEHADELRELLRSLVRTTSSLGDGTGGKTQSPESTTQKILEELVKIRLVLEQQKK